MTTEIEPNDQASTSERADPNRYNPGAIEQKWQTVWAEKGQNHADDNDPGLAFITW
jgi:hypothetical protein